MDYEITDIVTLDNDNEYVVAATTNLDNKNFIALVNLSNMGEIMYCYVKENNALVELNENQSNLCKRLTEKFNTEILNFIDNNKDLFKSIAE